MNDSYGNVSRTPRNKEEDTYRVFISYSHEDLELVLRIVEVLDNNRLTPMWDKNFSYGTGFHEQIKTFIAHAHVFLPVITEASSRRGWVHQEIGYAMALNVPVLPVTLGTLPGEMIRELHAVQLSEDLGDVEVQLSKEVFDNLVNRHSEPSRSLFHSAELAEDRAIMMAEYANNVIRLGAYGCVRQKGALSSFHIPNKVITHPIWKQRYGEISRSPFHCRCQRDERIELEKHARVNGCRLIIDPYFTYEQYGSEAKIVRLESLIEFLESMPDGKVEVAINNKMHQEESLTLVGDWFAAESVSATIGLGYRQTIFTCHAPSMWSRIELFDQEHNELKQSMGWTAESSKLAVINIIKEIIADIK